VGLRLRWESSDGGAEPKIGIAGRELGRSLRIVGGLGRLPKPEAIPAFKRK
jgi:hypothetical protein